MVPGEVEHIRERLSVIEAQHGETAKLVAVLASEMAGIRWLLRLILGTIIVGIIIIGVIVIVVKRNPIKLFFPIILFDPNFRPFNTHNINLHVGIYLNGFDITEKMV